MLYNFKDLKLILVGGKGGDGKIIKIKNKFNKTKWVRGKGGDGGSIYAFFDKFLKNLNYYYFFYKYISESGKNSKSLLKDGKKGKNILLRLPENCILNNNLFKKRFKVLKILLLKGGRGGASSKTKFMSLGKEGFSGTFILDLIKTFHFSFIGLPNSGKSSFFSNFLNYKNNKISLYKFTTLLFFFFYLKFKNLILNFLDTPGILKSLFFNFFNIFFKNNKFKIFLLFFDILQVFKFFISYKIFNKKFYNFNKNFFYKPKVIIISKIDILKIIYLKKKNINYIFLKLFNWRYLVFYNSIIYYKKNNYKIIKTLTNFFKCE
ncbi:MAG: GTPase [Candidatus Nasuia deltocephalinicola]